MVKLIHKKLKYVLLIIYENINHRWKWKYCKNY